VIEGVKLVQKLLESTLAKHGVVGFSAVGKPFDPNVHEALMQAESDQPPNVVLSEMARGYKLNERLMRPAAVVVAKARTAPAPEAAKPPEEALRLVQLQRNPRRRSEVTSSHTDVFSTFDPATGVCSD